MRRKLVPFLVVLACVPFLAAPPIVPCGVCKVTGSVAKQASRSHDFRLFARSKYDAELTFAGGNVDLTIAAKSTGHSEGEMTKSLCAATKRKPNVLGCTFSTHTAELFEAQIRSKAGQASYTLRLKQTK